MILRDEEIPLRQASQHGAEQAGRVAADKGGDDDGRIDRDKWCALIKIARPPLQRRGGADRREGDEVADHGMPPKKHARLDEAVSARQLPWHSDGRMRPSG